MDLSPAEIAEMRHSDPELYTSTLESKLEMMYAEIKHQVRRAQHCFEDSTLDL
jgi:hypothetical protein